MFEKIHSHWLYKNPRPIPGIHRRGH